MNMKKTIYTVIATLLFLISSCTLEQEVYNKIGGGRLCDDFGNGDRLCGKYMGVDYRI